METGGEGPEEPGGDLPVPGELVGGRFRVIRPLGRGGVGIVFEAREEPGDARVALKVLSRRGHRDIVRFRREQRALAALHSPHVVALLGSGTYRGVPFLAMELVDGFPLDRAARQGRPPGPVPWECFAPYAVQLLTALQQVHGEGIVHRDLKPGNVFVDRRGVVRLLDFGLAWGVGEGEVTETGTVVGTVRYMAPEQVTGEEVDHRADLYAVGILLYELLAGEYPYPDGPAPVLLHQHLYTRPRDPRLRVPDMPERLAQLLLHLLEKRKERRPADAGEVLERLGPLRPEGAVEIHGAPAGSVAGRLAPLPLIGRDRERARIDHALDDVISGRSRVVCITGEAGSGKTRLVSETLRAARRRGLRWVEARPGAWASGAYSAVLPVLSQLFAAEGASVGPEEARLLRALLASRGASTTDPLTEAPWEPGTGPLTLDRARASRDVAFEELAIHLILEARSEPLALVFDDLDRADRASRELVMRLATRAVPAPDGSLSLLLLVTARDEEVEVRLRGASGAVGVCHIPLARLRASELCEWFEPGPGAAEIAWRLRERSGGLPRDAVEIVRDALRRRRLERAPSGRLRPGAEFSAASGAPSIDTGEIPAGGLSRAERLKLRRLPEEVQRTVRAASVIGARFSFELLAAATGEDGFTLLDHLEQGEEAGIFEERTGPDTVYAAFADEGLAERLRATLPREELRAVRQRIVRALLDDGRPLGLPAERAASLLREAGAHRAAARWDLRAAVEHRRHGDRAAALECARRAAESARAARDRAGEVRALQQVVELAALEGELGLGGAARERLARLGGDGGA